MLKFAAPNTFRPSRITVVVLPLLTAFFVVALAAGTVVGYSAIRLADPTGIRLTGTTFAEASALQDLAPASGAPEATVSPDSAH